MFEAVVLVVASIGIQLYLFVLIIMTKTSVHIDGGKVIDYVKVKYDLGGMRESCKR